MKKLIFIVLLFPFALFSQVPGLENGAIYYSPETGGDNGLLNGLVSVWEFNETSGTTAFDSHGSNDGTNNGATINQTGVTNLTPCYDFDGSNDNISLGTSLTNGFTAFSVSMWVYGHTPLNEDVYNILLGKNKSTWSSPYYQISFRIRSSSTFNSFGLFIGGSSTYAGTISAENSYSPNTWYHVVGTWDSTDGGEIIVYVNGSASSHASYTNGSLTSSLASYTTDLKIGYLGGGTISTFKYFNGLIDQAAIWNRRLSPSEVITLYNSGNGLAYIDFTAFLELKMNQLWQQFYYPTNEIKTPLRIVS